MQHLGAWRTLSALGVAVVVAACGSTPPSPSASADPSATPAGTTSSAQPASPTASQPATPAPTAAAELAMSGVPRAPAPPAEAKKGAASIDAFGLDLLRNAGKPGANLVLSPTSIAVSYTHLRAHETDSYLVCRLLL